MSEVERKRGKDDNRDYVKRGRNVMCLTDRYERN